MFQDIAPHHLSIEYKPDKLKAGDYLICVENNKVLVIDGEKPALPRYGAEPFGRLDDESSLLFLLSVDGISFFLLPNTYASFEKASWAKDMIFRTMEPSWVGFAAVTAFHLAKWYDRHRYCGRCKTPLMRQKAERALECPACKASEYPAISPCIIVGITDKDKILLTRYAVGEYKRHALVAGFVEVGETLEDAVRREAMEEVGLKVRNIRYYKSQPWGFSESILAGFFAEADSREEISIDKTELQEAQWFSREELPRDDTLLFSLTWDMIEAFRRGTF